MGVPLMKLRCTQTYEICIRKLSHLFAKTQPQEQHHKSMGAAQNYSFFCKVITLDNFVLLRRQISGQVRAAHPHIRDQSTPSGHNEKTLYFILTPLCQLSRI